MKGLDPGKDTALTWGSDLCWGSFSKPTSHLRLNTLDFSDLWDEEDLGLDIDNKDRTGVSPGLQSPPVPPPAPPLLAPPLPPALPKGMPVRSRTLKLHWRELQSLLPLPRVTRFGTQTIWACLEPVQLDKSRLEYLFETKATSVTCNMAGAYRKPTVVSVLEVKRSNIITIALSSLPPTRLLPPAIYRMDDRVLEREDVQRLQELVPSEEEIVLIQEAKAKSPHLPLGQAELCLLTLGEIPHLSSRLQLWAFALDYDILEREIAEPLFHLKLAMKQLAASQTFRYILATVLAIGNFLNGCKARGFELSYLGKLSQVRDTHCRQPLLHHVCVLVLQLYPQSSDLYSNITAVMRASKCDYSLVQANLSQLEARCKASREQLKVLERSDDKRTGGKGEKKRGGGEDSLRSRLPKFLKECEERVKVLRDVHRRVINRFHSFLLFLGYSKAMVRETNAEDFCKTVSNFSLEYRTVRQAILQQQERERALDKGRGEKLASNTPGARRKPQLTPSQVLTQPECVEQFKLEEVLKTPEPCRKHDLSLPRNRRRMADIHGPFSRKIKK